MAGLVAFCLVAGLLLVSLWPILFLDDEREVAEARRLVVERTAERDRLLDALKDVDLDLQMGKLSPEDHAQVKAGLERQALAVIAALERDTAAAEEAADAQDELDSRASGSGAPEAEPADGTAPDGQPPVAGGPSDTDPATER